MQMRLCSIDIDERGEDDGDGDFCPCEDVGHECGEGGVFGGARCAAATGRGGGTPYGVVHCVNDGIYDVFWEAVSGCFLWVAGGLMDLPMTGRESFMSRSSRRAGEWREASTRLAL